MRYSEAVAASKAAAAERTVDAWRAEHDRAATAVTFDDMLSQFRGDRPGWTTLRRVVEDMRSAAEQFKSVYVDRILPGAQDVIKRFEGRDDVSAVGQCRTFGGSAMVQAAEDARRLADRVELLVETVSRLAYDLNVIVPELDSAERAARREALLRFRVRMRVADGVDPKVARALDPETWAWVLVYTSAGGTSESVHPDERAAWAALAEAMERQQALRDAVNARVAADR